MLNRGEFCLVACRSGIDTANDINEFITNLCCEENRNLENKGKLSLEEKRAFEFSKEIAENGVSLLHAEIRDFKDGEIFVGLQGSVRGKDVYVVQNTLDPKKPEATNQNIMELLVTIDAIKRSGARHISAVIPYFSYCKQERRRGRESIATSLLIRMLQTAGINGYIITVDLHSDVAKGFSDPNIMKIENLFASSILIDYFQNIMGPDDVFAAPDAGAAKMVQHYSKVTGKEMVIAYKYRSMKEAHKIDEHRLLGEVKGKRVVIIDDQIATGGTMGALAEKAKEHGATEVHVGVTHGPLFEEAEEKLKKLYEEKKVDSIVTTNTLRLSKEFLERNQFIKVLSITGFLGRAIYELHTDNSIKKMYNTLLRKELFGI